MNELLPKPTNSCVLDDVAIFRAIMIANGDPDPGSSASGMLENCTPADRDYVTRLTATISSMQAKP